MGKTSLLSNLDFRKRKMILRFLTLISILLYLPGVLALTDADVGVVAAGVISGLILICIVVGIPIFIYLRNKKKNAGDKRPPNHHFANGSAFKPQLNGFPKPRNIPPGPEVRGYPKPRPQRERPVNAYPQPQRRPQNANVRTSQETPIGTFRGVPFIHITPHGSHRGTPRGTVRGGIIITDGRTPPVIGPYGPRGYPMGPRGRGVPYPGPYNYPDPMMYPYFFPPPMVYVDESDSDSSSDDDRRSNRSTIRERKMRYHRSFMPDRQSKLVIKEIDSEEEKKIKEENRNKNKQSKAKSRSRSRTPEERGKKGKQKSKSRSRSPSPERYRTSTNHDIYTEVSKTNRHRRNSSTSGGDAAAKIDEMFSFSSDASTKPGDIIFLPPGQHLDTSPRKREPTPPRREPSPPRQEATPPRRSPSPQRRSSSPQRRTPSPPRRDPSPTPRRMPSPVHIREATPPRPERKPVKETSEYMYASVIRPSEEPEQYKPNELRVSMSERIQNIVDTGHTSVLNDLERHTTENIQYPPKRLSQSTREYPSTRNTSSYNKFSATSRPDLYDTNRQEPLDLRRPPTPPNDIPNETPIPTPRQSLIRRPETPPNDIPLSSRSERPPTPPFDGDDISRSTSTPAPDRKLPPAPPIPPPPTPKQPEQKNLSNLGNTNKARSAFSNLVLEELKERHRMPEVDEDDSESARNRAVNFSASPPEIIPSPRTSEQNLYPDEPPKERAPPPPPPAPPIPPPPPAPPIPPPPPLPK